MNSLVIWSIGSAGQRRIRSARGQAIAEGAAILPLIIVIAVFLIMFLIYAGTTLYYRAKLSFVANQVAMFAANRLIGDGSDYDQTVINALPAQINQLTDTVGLPRVSSQAKEEATQFSVRLTMSGFKLFDGVIPTIPFVEIGAALIDDSKPKFACVLTECNAQTGVRAWVPCFGISAFNGTANEFLYPVGNNSPSLPRIGIVSGYSGGGTINNPGGTTIFNSVTPSRGGGPITGVVPIPGFSY